MNSLVELWLGSLSPNTRRAYANDLASFMDYTCGTLRSATSKDVQGWLASLQRDGRTVATINRKRAALSSFYRYACGYDGWTNNPVQVIPVQPLSPYGRSKYPSTAQVQALLEAIPMDTAQGKRDLAILAGLFVTTRRVNEWVTLRWSQIHTSAAGGHWFEYIAKGDQYQRQAIPSELWTIMLAYWTASGRWPLAAGDPLFVAHSDNGRRLHNGQIPARQQPLSCGYVRQVIRRYGKHAGIDLDLCHPHGLRHAGARARKDAGASAFDLQTILAHRDIRTTMIYTKTVLEEPQDNGGDQLVSQVLPKVLRYGRA